MKKLIIWAVIVGAVSYGGAKLYLHSEVSDAMDMAVMLASPYAKIDYDGVSSTMSGELTVDDVVVRISGFRDEIYIERIGIDTPSFLSLLKLSDAMQMQADGMPKYFGFLVDGLRMPVSADYFKDMHKAIAAGHDGSDADDAAVTCTGKYGFSPSTLAALGYKDQVFSMALKVSDDGPRYSVDMQLRMDDMWDVDANVALAGNLMTEMAKGVQYRPRLNDLRLEYTDQSLNERVNEYCQKLGLSADEILKAQMDSFKYAGASNGIEFDEYMLEPYQEFLQGKSRLIITANPNEPIAFSQIDLYKPSDVPALLNLEATAE